MIAVSVRSTWLTTTVSLAMLSAAVAQPQPARVIKTVVPFAAGGAVDTLARLLADQIGRTQGVTFVVENRPGAGTAIGTDAVARAAADGTTILMMANSFVINPHLKTLSYDPLSFEPICLLVRSPHLVLVNSSSSHRTLADLLDAARAKPGGLTMAANGPATSQHIAFEMLRAATKIDVTFVPYGGSAPAVQALLGDHVSAAFADHADVAELLRAGKLRALATGSSRRIEALPDVQTIAEAGYKEFEAEGTLGIVAPAMTPKDKISQLIGWFTSALAAPEIQPRLAAHGLYPVGLCGAGFGTHLRKQYDAYGAVIRDAKLASP